MKKNILLLLVLILFLSLSAERKFPIPQIDQDPLNYVCYKSPNNLIIDGKLDDESWTKAVWTESFLDIEGSLKPSPPFVTKAKMLWNNEYFYIGAYLEESDLWATITKRDEVIFWDNDFEVFIDPDGDTHDYYELEVNALNTVWDLLVIKPYRDRGQVAFNSWDFKGIKTAVYLEGSLNNSSDIDQYWTLEIAIPWESLAEAAHKETPPRDKDIWKINFSRVQWQLEKKENSYIKKINPQTGRHFPEMNIVWSPQGLIAMHYPEMWGDVMFSKYNVGETNVDFIPDYLLKEKKYLRQVYYQEKEYFLQNGYYTADFELLGLPKADFKDYNEDVDIYVSPNTFHIILKSKNDNPDLHIFNDGRLLQEIDFH